jgi:hypothetical protein
LTLSLFICSSNMCYHWNVKIWIDSKWHLRCHGSFLRPTSNHLLVDGVGIYYQLMCSQAKLTGCYFGKRW